ncbi:MAG: Rha family transcriptional regulator [Bacteroidales bacterium]|nr:Rha family transcriptional regulator [Bacteroidales bacterium]
MTLRKNESPAPTKNELVFIENDKPITTSRLIARTFGKQHAHVLRDLQNLGCSEEFTESNFGLSSYKDKSGKVNKEYHITKDGFTMLAFGYTGEKAMKFKEAYIGRFNLMEKELHEREMKNYLPQHAGKVGNMVYPCKMGSIMTDCYYTGGIVYVRFSLLLSYLKYSSGTSKTLREKLGEENFIAVTINKQEVQFGNLQAYKNFLTRTTTKPVFKECNQIAMDIWGVNLFGASHNGVEYTHHFTMEEIFNIITEVNKFKGNPQRVQDVNDMLMQGGGRI